MKFRLLLLDANVVIHLHEIELWERFVDECEVILSRTVMEREVLFFEDSEGQQPIDLSHDEQAGRIKVVDVPVSEVMEFKNRFDVINMERLDPGEAESLAYLVSAQDPHLICSSDGIVFRALALLDRAEQGISLEEILMRLGLGRRLVYQFTKKFRERYTEQGRQDRIQGRGLR